MESPRPDLLVRPFPGLDIGVRGIEGETTKPHLYSRASHGIDQSDKPGYGHVVAAH
jgi:hypothetical protein